MRKAGRMDRRHQDNMDPSLRQAIGAKGGRAVSRNREHMSEIGRKGGRNSHKSR